MTAASGRPQASTAESAVAGLPQSTGAPSASSSPSDGETQSGVSAGINLAIDVAAQNTAQLPIGQQTNSTGADSTSKVAAKSDQQTVGKDAAAQDQSSLGVTSTAGAKSLAASQVDSNDTTANNAANTAANAQQRSQEIVDRVTNTLRTGFDTGGEMRVRLEPPELGRVQVDVSAANGGVTARMEVQTASARQTLLDNISMLHDAIAQTGASVNRIDVVLAPQPRDDSASERQASSGGQQQSSSQGNSPGGSGNQPNGQQQNQTWRRSPSIDQLDIEV